MKWEMIISDMVSLRDEQNDVKSTVTMVVQPCEHLEVPKLYTLKPMCPGVT